MKTARRILLLLSLIVVICLLIAGGILAYFHFHPEKMKGMVEESLSGAVGADLTVGSLSYSMNPLSLSASDILVRNKGQASGFLLRIPTLNAGMALQGSFGRRTLVVRELSLPKLSLNISREAELPGFDFHPGTPSLPARIATGLVSLLLFRDVRLDHGSIEDGSVVAEFVEGRIRLSRIHGEFRPAEPPEVTCRAELRLGNGLTADLPLFRITGPKVFSLSDPVTGRLSFNSGVLSFPGVKVSALSGTGNFTAKTLKHIAFELLDFSASPVVVSLKGREIRIEKARLTADQGFLDPGRYVVSFPAINISSSLVRNMRAGLEIDAVESRIALSAEKARIWEPLNALNLIPAGWTFSGEDGFQGKATINENGWFFSGNLNLKETGFQDPTGNYVGEGILLEANFEGKSSAGRPMGLKYSAKMGKGEILFDRTYVDLNRNSFHFSGDAEIGLAMERARSTFTMKLEEILSLSGRTALEFEKRDPFLLLAFHVPETPLGPVFQHLLAESYKREVPFLDGMNASGDFSADVELSIGSGWRLKSRCRMLQGTISSRDPFFRLQGVRLDLPLFLASGTVEGSESETGTLQIDSMELPFLPPQPLDVETTSGQNTLFLKGPTTLMVDGGNVEIGSVSAAELVTGPVIRTSLSVKELGLDPVLSKIWPRSVQGRLTGRLDPVLYAEGAISAKGTLKADLFGGEAVIENLGVTGPLTFPVLSLDARWEDISLLELTRDTSFGRIQGTLRGRVKGLEIAQVQPQRFDLFMETVQKEGIPQKISIAAVDNIARIGSGQSPFMGAAGLFSKFFREFNYSKIGVKAILENDTFRVNGTIREGDVEYLVKRGGFSGVNVVNQNPDNRISFKDMLKRIQRIGSSESAPVIR
ncbi:MAG: hypothetical protein PHS17_13590 [Desulfobacterales bacterium]|nr:hypothetical protein [Desulfobacterales bacterium]